MSMNDLQVVAHDVMLSHAEAGSEYDAPQPREETSSLDLSGFFRILKQQWMLIALMTVLAVFAAMVYSVTATSKFTASSKILINPQPKRVFGSDYIPQDGNTNQILIESQTRVIGSSSVLLRVVRSERLVEDPEFVPPKTAGLKDRVLGLIGLAADEEPPLSLREKQIAALRHLQQRLTVKRPSQTYVIEVEVSSRNPQKAARLSRAVALAYIADQADAQASSTREVSKLLQGRLAVLRRKVAEAENSVQAYKQKHNIVSTDGSLINERQLSRLNDELSAARERVSVAAAKAAQVRRFIKSGSLPESIGEAVSSRLVSSLRGQYARASRRASQLASVYGARHPQLIAARAEVAQSRRLINEELRRVAATLENSLKVEQRRARSLLARINRSRGVTDVTNKARVRLAALQREANASRAVYERVLAKARESSAEEKINLIDARIISYATAPLWASWPKKRILLPLALVFGLGFGVAGALVNDYRRDRFSSLREVEQLTHMPVLGTLPEQKKARTGEKKMAGKASGEGREADPKQSSYYRLYLELAQVGSPYAAAVMNLVRNLERSVRGVHGSSIMMVSSSPCEGSSSVAWSAAIAAAMQNRRVLLIDGDGGDGELARTLAPGSADRISQVVAGQARLADLIVEDKGLGLSFLALSPSRKTQEKTSWLDYQALLRQLPQIALHYDLVFVDGGAISNSGLAHMLVDKVDRVALVLNVDETSRKSVDEALHALGAPKDKMCGVIASVADPELV